jgi:hypothetical protein
VSKANKVAQLRKADRQGRNDSGKGETLAETLAEQSRLSERLSSRGVPRNDRQVVLTALVDWLPTRSGKRLVASRHLAVEPNQKTKVRWNLRAVHVLDNQ